MTEEQAHEALAARRAAPSKVRDVCREHFARTWRTVQGKRRITEYGCDKCPIRVPCNEHGGRPAGSLVELYESATRFDREALAILERIAGA